MDGHAGLGDRTPPPSVVDPDSASGTARRRRCADATLVPPPLRPETSAQGPRTVDDQTRVDREPSTRPRNHPLWRSRTPSGSPEPSDRGSDPSSGPTIGEGARRLRSSSRSVLGRRGLAGVDGGHGDQKSGIEVRNRKASENPGAAGPVRGQPRLTSYGQVCRPRLQPCLPQQVRRPRQSLSEAVAGPSRRPPMQPAGRFRDPPAGIVLQAQNSMLESIPPMTTETVTTQRRLD